MRVGVFIGRLGVISLPTVSVGLGLAERVVRRHVSRLEGLGWLGRVAALRGEGSLVWLTNRGLHGVGLGQLPAVRAPDPFSMATHHSVQVGWSAARVHRRGYAWRCARELTLDEDSERWSIPVRNERGGISRRLPDLAVWPPESLLPAGLVIEHGVKREQRRRLVLEGWQAAIDAGRYARVQYDCSSPALARELTRIAAQLGLADPQFRAVQQTPPEQIAELPPAEPDPPASAAPPATPTPPAPAAPPATPTPPAAVWAPAPPGPASNVELDHSLAQEPVQTPEQAAERQRFIDELLGRGEPKPRRRWRR